MTLEEFAQVTVNVLGRSGIEEYEPTLLVPSLRHASVIAGFPEGLDPIEGFEAVIQDQKLGDVDVLFGIRQEANVVLIGHRKPDGSFRLGRIHSRDDGFETEFDIVR